MKIIKFGVNNFGCITGGIVGNTIDFENSNTIFIFGQNNSGKSTFLRAYEYFFEDKNPLLDDFYKQNLSNQIEILIELELSEEEKGQLRDKRQNAEDKYFYGDGANRLSFKKIWSSERGRSNNLTMKKDSSGFDDVGYAGVGEHNVFKNMLPIPISIKAMPNEGDVDNIVNIILSEKVRALLNDKELEEYKKAEEVIRAFQKKAYDNDEIKKYKGEVNKYFSSVFKDIKINISEKDPGSVLRAIDKKFEISFEHLDVNKNIIRDIPTSFQNLGHGAIRTAIFSLFLMKDVASGKITDNSEQKRYLVLFEEPELFLHPKLIKTLRDLVYQVSAENTPFQALCASHSPQMIDVTKPNSSLVRLVKKDDKTNIYQVDESILMEQDDQKRVRRELYEALRFNPYVCESFYADEVVLIEGDTEAVFMRAYFQAKEPPKDIFIVNCGSVNNIPFFQQLFSRFNIKYHVICDTDDKDGKKRKSNEVDEFGLPVFIGGIQKTRV